MGVWGHMENGKWPKFSSSKNYKQLWATQPPDVGAANETIPLQEQQVPLTIGLSLFSQLKDFKGSLYLVYLSFDVVHAVIKYIFNSSTSQKVAKGKIIYLMWRTFTYVTHIVCNIVNMINDSNLLVLALEGFESPATSLPGYRTSSSGTQV